MMISLLRSPWSTLAVTCLLLPSYGLAKQRSSLGSRRLQIETQVGCRQRTTMPKTSKAPSTGKGMSLGKGSITSLKKTSVSHHSMKKTPKSPKTKSPGHSHSPAMVLPFCDEYCDALDESSLSTVVYRAQLTLSILDTVEAPRTWG